MNIGCPSCSGNRRKMHKLASKMLDLPENHSSRVVICADCKTKYLWPGIPAEDVSAMYADSYFLGTQSIINTTTQIPATESCYANDAVPVRLEKYRETINKLLAMLPSAKNILDIGAATGDFLSLAREAGLEISGIELSDFAASEAKSKYGFVFFNGDLLDYPLAQKYDLIHMNHVFEHFQRPGAAIEKIDKLLNPGGFIYLEVPFQFNLIELIMYVLFKKKKKYDVFSLHHPVFYTPSTLKHLFAEKGYSCKYISLFSWTRYKAESGFAKIKKLLWAIMSVLGQGIYIEAVFERNHKS